MLKIYFTKLYYTIVFLNFVFQVWFETQKVKSYSLLSDLGSILTTGHARSGKKSKLLS